MAQYFLTYCASQILIFSSKIKDSSKNILLWFLDILQVQLRYMITMTWALTYFHNMKTGIEGLDGSPETTKENMNIFRIILTKKLAPIEGKSVNCIGMDKW